MLRFVVIYALFGNLCAKKGSLGYFFTSDSFDGQVDHRIYRLIRVAVNFWGSEGWVSACHHCRVVPDDKDTLGILRSRSGVRPSVWRPQQHYQSKSKKCKSHGSVPVVEHIGNEMDCQRNFCQLQGSCCTMDMERKLHMLNRSGPFIQCISGQIKHCSTP